MPGHTTSWLVAHPEWGALDEARTVSTRFGPHSACLDPTRDEVYDALGRLFDDVVRMFPDRFVHIGGDEVNPKWWQESAAVQRFMRERGIGDIDALHESVQRTARRSADRSRPDADGLGRNRARRPAAHVDRAELARRCVARSRRGTGLRLRLLGGLLPRLLLSGGSALRVRPGESVGRTASRSTRACAPIRASRTCATDSAGRASSRVAARWMRHRRAACRRAACSAAKRACGPRSSTTRFFEGRVWGRLPAIAERLWSPRSLRDECGHVPAAVAAAADARRFCRRRRRCAAARIVRAHRRRCGGTRRSCGICSMRIEPIKWYSRLLGAGGAQSACGGFD